MRGFSVVRVVGLATLPALQSGPMPGFMGGHMPGFIVAPVVDLATLRALRSGHMHGFSAVDGFILK